MRSLSTVLLATALVLGIVIGFVPAQQPVEPTPAEPPQESPTPPPQPPAPPEKPSCNGSTPKKVKCSYLPNIGPAPEEAAHCEKFPTPNNLSGTCSFVIEYLENNFECNPAGTKVDGPVSG